MDTKLNIELFTKIREKIANAPEAYDQRTYGREESRAPCGTAACIAGWACELGGALALDQIRLASTLQDSDGFYPLIKTIPETAQALLGLEDDEAYMLFTESPDGEEDSYGEKEYGWPEPFREEWEEARSGAERTRVAVAYLDHIIATGRITE